MGDKYVCTLTPELKEKAKKELMEKEEWRDRDIQALRERVLNNKALTSRTDSAFLLRFLRARKFDYERSYKLLENYFRIRAENMEHFSNLKPSLLEHIWEAGITQVLPKPDAHGRRIVYFRPGRWEPSKYPIFDILKANAINFELMINDEATQVNGVVFVGNAEGMGWEHAKNMSRDYFRLTTSLMQDAFPCRLKSMDMVNEPSVFGYIFNLFKPFLKDKLKSRMHFHGPHPEKLIDDKENGLTPDMLPQELGGTLPHGDELAKEWKKVVLAKESYFEEMAQYKMTLARNISSTSVDPDVCGSGGITGTFRKLNVD